MSRFVAGALVSLVAVLVTAVPAGAASGPFTDYRQAAQAQYGGNPPGPPPGRPPENPGPGNPPGPPPGRPPGQPPGQGTAPGSETGGQGQGQGQGLGQGQGQGTAGANAAATPTATLFFLSPVDPVIVSSVNAVLARLGQPPAQAVSLNEPLNVPGIATAASGTKYANVTAERVALMRALGRKVGRELFKPSPFFSAVGPVLFAGLTTFEPQRYAIFARTGTKLDKQATRIRNAFENGLVRGVRASRIEVDGKRRKVPTAGVETTRSSPSQIKWYKTHRIPSVDNVETVNGQKALLAILRDGAKGHYGVKDTAQRLLPKSVKADPASAAILDAKGDSEGGLGTGLAITLLALMGAWTALTVFGRARRSRQASR